MFILSALIANASNAQNPLSQKIFCTTTYSTTPITVCSSQLPFKWNSNTYISGGVFKDTLINVAGCDSIVTLNLTVSYPITSTTNVTICPNQLPYKWNGNTYTVSGLYSVTLNNSLDCDSIAELNLAVKNNTSSATKISICAFQLPYIWNGSNYNAAGTYKVTLTNSEGCDSIATLNLSVKNPSKSTTNISICATAIPYKWNGNNYNATGTYKVTLTNTAGCDSIATLNLNVKSISSSTTNVSICTSQVPFVWNGKSYNTSGTYVDTLMNSEGCDSIASLNLTVLTTISTVFNITICPAQLPYKWNGNTYTSAGTYNINLKSSGGCDSVVTLNLSVSNTIRSTTYITICSKELPFVWNGSSYTATGIYTFSLASTGGCDSIATLNLSVQDTLRSHSPISVCSTQLPYSFHGKQYTTGGSYYDTSVNKAGCDSISWLELTVINTTASTNNISICTNQAPYFWNGNTYSVSGTYKTTLVNYLGCDSVATLNLLISDTVRSVTNVSVCENALPYTWNNNTYNTQGAYNITLVSSSGCDSLATLNLTVNNTTTSSTNLSICPNNLPYTWNGKSFAKAGSYSIKLINATGCDSIAVLNLIVRNTTTVTTITICPNQLPFLWNSNSYNAAGTYSVTLPGSGGCDSIATLNLNVNTVSTSNTNAATCSNQLPYLWNGKTYSATGIYTTKFTNAVGCDSIATLNLKVSDTTKSITNVTVCQYNLPFIWNENTYTQAGTYSVKLTNVAGCDSIAELNLDVNQPTTSTTSINICSNQLPYLWNGNAYNGTGTYTIKLTNAAGCDSVTILNLIVKDTSVGTTIINICSSQLPFTWNNSVYTKTGTYKVNLINAAGCDSIAILSLTVSDSTSSLTTVIICPQEAPYAWNGNNYSKAGTYKIKLINEAGCDSMAILNLIINDTTASTTNIKICSNQLPYKWNGSSYSTSGTYKVTLTNAGGCDSIATLNFNINDTTTSITNVGVCENQLPYKWNGSNYTEPGSYTATLTNATGCDSVATLNLSISDTSLSTTSVNICSNQLPYIWNNNTYTLTGTYSIKFTNAAGCDSLATLNLLVSNTTSGFTSIKICSNQLPFKWNGNIYNTAGQYKVMLKNSAGCDSLATLNLAVGNTTGSTTNISICSNQLPYIWNGKSYLTSGTYKTTLTNAAGCDSITVLDLKISDTSQSVINIHICQKQLPYIWNGLSYNMSGNYTAKLKNAAGCDSVAVLNLTVRNATASTTNINICPNQLPYTWNGNNYTAPGIYIVTLPNSAGCDSVATLNLAILTMPAVQTTQLSGCGSLTFRGINYISSTTLTDTLKSVGGCDSAYFITVVNILPNNFNLNLNASPETIYNGVPVTLSTSGNIPYNILEWQPASLFRAQNTLTQTFVADTSLQILAIGRSNTGCIDSNTLSLTVKQVNTVYIPSAFTPNGDGKNDVFKPMVYGKTTHYHFVVYNRWGKKVFETDTPGFGWDGLINSQQQPVGTFVWMLSYTLTNGISKTADGTVVLMR